MAFQFLCPQGHLLQGDEAQAGQQCRCPQCGMAFYIPQPMPRAAPAQVPTPPPTAPAQVPTPPPGLPAGAGQPAPPSLAVPPSYAPLPAAPSAVPPAEPPSGAPEGGFPGIQTEPDPRLSPSRAAAPRTAPQTEAMPELVHIPCPKGHELETPREWIGKLAMCPFCKAKFYLRWEKSFEYRHKKVEEDRRKQERAAKLWLQWSIGTAVAVILGLILLVVLSRAL